MVFYKMQGNEMKFQLVNTQVTEDFKLWDNVNKRFIREIEGVANFNDLKFMKLDIFQQKYPNMRKSTQYIRNIVVNEGQEDVPTQYSYGFKKTADEQIRLAINNAISFKQDIREYEITLRKTGEGKETIYSIIVGQKLGLPTITLPEYPPKQEKFIVPKSIPNMQSVIALNEKEQVVYGLACEYAGTLTADEFVLGFQHTYKKIWNEDILSSRVLEIFQKLYNN